MRKAEILNLKWSNIDFDYEYIELLETKSGKSRKIPISRKLMKIFKELYAISTSEYVFVKFYEKYVYFYVYNNKVFVSEKLLRANIEKEFRKDEIREFKRMYCYLARVASIFSITNVCLPPTSAI